MVEPKPVRPRVGVDYHDKIERNGVWFTVCPFCGKAYRAVRKDFESFRLSAAALKHLEDVHYEGRRET
jgi:hypothetical protein